MTTTPIHRYGTEECLASDGEHDRLTLFSAWTGGTVSLTVYTREHADGATYELSPREARLLRDELTARLDLLGRER